MNRCFCCPRHCAVDRRTETGFCDAGQFPRVARVAPHFWEEPMLSGSKGAGTVFFSGCNLGCIFCQNMEISAAQKGAICDAKALASLFLALQAQGVHNIDLVTPTPHLDMLRPAIQGARERGLRIPIVYNSGGYESVEALQSLNGLIDIYLPDLKYYSPARSRAYCRAGDYFLHASAAVREMYAQVGELVLGGDGIAMRGLLIRHLVLPGNLDETRHILDFIRHTFPPGTYISLMRQYTPLSAPLPPPLNRRLTDREYARAVEYCIALGLSNVLVQDAESSGMDFIPKFYDDI